MVAVQVSEVPVTTPVFGVMEIESTVGTLLSKVMLTFDVAVAWSLSVTVAVQVIVSAPLTVLR